MKKFYTILAALFMGVAANAQLYLCGTGSVGETALGWNPEAPYVVSPAADGTYKFTVTNSNAIKMSTTKAGAGEGWDPFNAGAVGVYTIEVGENELITEGFSDTANSQFAWQGDWTVTVNIAAKTLIASTTTPKPTGFTKLYIAGKVDGISIEWGFTEENEMSTTDGVIYSKDNVQFGMGNEFKIAGKDWSPNYGGAQTLYPGVPVVLEGGANPANLKVGVPYTGKVSFNKETLELIFGEFAGIEDIEADNNVAPVYYNLQGVRVEKAENGLFIEVRGNKAVKVVK